MVSEKDRIILRDLAKKQMEYAKSEQMVQLKKEWRRHNSFGHGRPMIKVETESFANDIIPQLLQCEGEYARILETVFRTALINHEVFGDDSVIRDYVPVWWYAEFVPFGIPVGVDHAESDANSLGHHFKAVINDLEEDYHKLGKSVWRVHKDAMKQTADQMNDIFGDIIPAKYNGNILIASITQDLVHIMDMETMFFSMMDYPELFKEMMDRLTDDYLEYFDFLSDEGMLRATTEDQQLCQGSYCFTDELPAEKAGVFRPEDIWGYMDSQETVGVSSEMFEEFIFPYYDKLAKRMGRISYGCCEPVDPIWDNCISKWENLRKVSISPWCKEEYMGEKLRGKKIVYLRKPSPNLIGVGGSALEEDEVRKHIAKTVQSASGCCLEFAQRDVYQVGQSPEKVKRYVEIIREECEKHKR